MGDSPSEPGRLSGRGDSRFHALLQRMGAVHDAKSDDYGAADDPLANLRAFGELGIEPWRGVLGRMADKWTRLKTYARTGKLSNESFEDSLIDLANYALLCLILHREGKE